MNNPTEPTGAWEDEAARVRAIRARGGAFHNETADLIESLQSALATARQERDDLKLQLSVVNTDKAAWWEGHDKAIAGAAMRWKQALETPIPKPGVMNKPLESLYRATESLRARIAELEREGKDGLEDRTFEYLLNAYQHAAQASNPHAEQYDKKRRAVFSHVRTLERAIVALRVERDEARQIAANHYNDFSECAKQTFALSRQLVRAEQLLHEILPVLESPWVRPDLIANWAKRAAALATPPADRGAGGRESDG